MKHPARIAALVFDLAGSPASEVQLLPAGQFSASDGRPGPGLSWNLDASVAARVIERFAARKNPAVIDYEHQTLYASYKDGAAPAAGWFDGLRFDTVGLWATGLKWTARASAMISAGEYRFISAVFSYLPDSGEILEIHHAGLTNDPALDGMAEVFSTRAAARFLPTSSPPENTVDRLKIIAALALAATATDADIDAALAALKAAAAQVEPLQAQLSAARAAAADPTKYVPVAVVTELRTELAALTAAQLDREVAELVTAALDDGRLSPAQEPWARDHGRADIASLRAYLATAQPIAALRGTQTKGRAPIRGADGVLDDVALAVCRQMGVPPEEYTKTAAAA